MARWNQNQGLYQYNVRDFGAVGDGVHDDTQAFRAAITLLLDMPLHLPDFPGGGKIIVPAGIYRITGTLQIQLPTTPAPAPYPPTPAGPVFGGIWIEGEGMDNTVISLDYVGGPDFDGILFNAIGGSPSGLRDLEINNFTSLLRSNNGVYIFNSNSIYLDHVWVNGLGTGVRVELSTDINLEECTAELNQAAGFYFRKAGRVQVLQCFTFRNGTSPPGLTTGDGFWFDDNTDIPTTPQVTPIPKGITVNGCLAVEDNISGFHIRNYSDLVMTGSRVNNAGDVNQSGASLPDRGIWLEGAVRVSIDGAWIQGVQTYGILVDQAGGGAASQSVSIINAIIDSVKNSSRTVSPSCYGIQVKPTCDYINILGGTISNIGGFFGTGISMAGAGEIIGVNIVDSGVTPSPEFTSPLAAAIELALGDTDSNRNINVIGNLLFNEGPGQGTAIKISGGKNLVIANNFARGFQNNLVANSPAPPLFRNIYSNGWSSPIAILSPAFPSNFLISPDSTPITAHYSGTASFSFGAIPAFTTFEGEIGIPAAVIGDSVEVTPGDSIPAGTSIELGQVWCGYVVRAGVVRVRVVNTTSGAIAVAQRTWRATVTRH